MVTCKDEGDAGDPRGYQADERGIKAMSMQHSHAVLAEQPDQPEDGSRILQP